MTVDFCYRRFERPDDAGLLKVEWYLISAGVPHVSTLGFRSRAAIRFVDVVLLNVERRQILPFVQSQSDAHASTAIDATLERIVKKLKTLTRPLR